MPPPQNNRLAPPLQNSLAYSVPVPLEPGMLRPAPTRFVPQRELENLSIGLGRGVRSGMEGTAQMLTQPVATAQALIEAARQIGTDPRIVLDMLRAARQKAMSGSLGLGELIGENITPGVRGRRVPVIRELDVYHGTPHRFPATEANPLGEFDASKIGTGEGAQAYGHGIYLAEAENVGRDYAQSLSQRLPNRVQLDNTPIKGDTIFSRAIEKLGTQGKEAALKDLDDSIRRNETYAPDMAELYRDVRRQILEIDPKKVNVNQGTLYKADLPDEMIDRMLDWDKPLSEQPFKIQQAIFNDLTDAGYSKAVVNDLLNRKTGMEFFRTLHTGLQQGESSAINLAKKLNLSQQEMFMDAPALASAVMRRMGIPGIKYLDAGSRGKGGSGTRNFVVFPGEEKKVRILERK